MIRIIHYVKIHYQTFIIVMLTITVILLYFKGQESTERNVLLEDLVTEALLNNQMTSLTDSILYKQIYSNTELEKFPYETTIFCETQVNEYNLSILVPKNSCQVCIDTLIAKTDLISKKYDFPSFTVITESDSPSDLASTIKKIKINTQLFCIESLSDLVPGIPGDLPFVICYDRSLRIISGFLPQENNYDGFEIWIRKLSRLNI